MKRLIPVVILLCCSCFAQLSTEQFCDGQQGAADALAPLISQFSLYVTPPMGKTAQDVFNYWDMTARIILGEECKVLRMQESLTFYESSLASFQTQLTAAQAKVADLQKQIAAITQAGAATLLTGYWGNSERPAPSLSHLSPDEVDRRTITVHASGARTTPSNLIVLQRKTLLDRL